MQSASFQGLASKARATIEMYGLCPTSDIAVACSGGKDSTMTCLVLRELGYRVIPLLVDMDYSKRWATRVSRNLTSLGFTPTVLSPTASDPAPPNPLLILNLEITRSAPTDPRFTPCTSCYNAKVLLLREYLVREGLDRIAFGHHATDAAASLVKSSLMYVDRWEYGHTTYEPARFRLLAQDALATIRTDSSSLLEKLGSLVDSSKASTDEPPVQDLVGGTEPLIVRPLFPIWESEIEEHLDLVGTSERSGCGHTLSSANQTPREIVQYELVRPLEREPDMRKAMEGLLTRGLSTDGRAGFKARTERDSLLGASYKPSFGPTKL